MTNNNSQLARINFSQNNNHPALKLINILDGIKNSTQMLYSLFIDQGILLNPSLAPHLSMVSNKIIAKRSISGQRNQI